MVISVRFSYVRRWVTTRQETSVRCKTKREMKNVGFSEKWEVGAPLVWHCFQVMSSGTRSYSELIFEILEERKRGTNSLNFCSSLSLLHFTIITDMMEWFCPAFLTREREIGERIVGFQERDSLDQTSTFPPLHHTEHFKTCAWRIQIRLGIGRDGSGSATSS